MTALPLLHPRQEAVMSRVEPKERPAKREAEGRRQSGERVDRTPTKVKSERIVEEASRDQERRS